MPVVYDIDNIHSLGSPKSLENGQKVDIGVEKTMPEIKKRKTVDITQPWQRSYAKTRAY